MLFVDCSFIFFLFTRYIEVLLDYLYDYSQRVLPLHDVEGVSLNST